MVPYTASGRDFLFGLLFTRESLSELGANKEMLLRVGLQVSLPFLSLSYASDWFGPDRIPR